MEYQNSMGKEATNFATQYTYFKGYQWCNWHIQLDYSI